MAVLNFGGLDIAQRVDNASFLMLERHEDGIFEEKGLKVWPHINFNQVGEDLGKIWQKERMAAIGYDRLGIGETAQQILPPYLPLHPIVSSQPAKHRMINMVAAMFHSGKLIIHSQELFEEIMEQEKKITDAGNIIYNHPAGHHDDRFWSLCYACEVASSYIQGRIRSISGSEMARNGSPIDDIIGSDIKKGLE